MDAITLISTDTEEVLFGSLLGDGCVVKPRIGNCRYFERHSLKQKDYLLWKLQYLRPFNPRIKEEIYYDGIAGTIGSIYVQSSRNPFFTNLREIIYINGKKRVEPLLTHIDKLGLLVWYCDDGTYHKVGRSCYLSTEAYSYHDHKVIQNWFKRKYCLDARIHKHEGKHRIHLTVKSTEFFLALISPLVPKISSVAHKFPKGGI